MRLLKLRSEDGENKSIMNSNFENMNIKANSQIALKNFCIYTEDDIIIDDTNNSCQFQVTKKGSNKGSTVLDDYFEIELNNGTYNYYQFLEECDRAFNQSVEYNNGNVYINGFQFYVHDEEQPDPSTTKFSYKIKIRFASAVPEIYTDYSLSGLTVDNNNMIIKSSTNNSWDGFLYGNKPISKSSGIYSFEYLQTLDVEWIAGFTSGENKDGSILTPDKFSYYVRCKSDNKLYVSFNDENGEQYLCDVQEADNIGSNYNYVQLIISEGSINVKHYHNGTLGAELEMDNKIIFENYYFEISIYTPDEEDKYFRVFTGNGLTSQSLRWTPNAFYKVNPLTNKVEANYDAIYDDLLGTGIGKYRYLYFNSNLNNAMGFLHKNQIYSYLGMNGVFDGETNVSILYPDSLTFLIDNMNLNSYSSITGTRYNILAHITNFNTVRKAVKIANTDENDDSEADFSCLSWEGIPIFIDINNNIDMDVSNLRIRVVYGDETKNKMLDICDNGFSATLIIKEKQEAFY